MDFIIWAIDDFNALALLRQLGQSSDANILFLIIGKGKYAYKSKFCNKYIETESLDEGYNYLLENYKDKHHKPVIFTSGDNVMVFIDDHRDVLSEYFYIPGCPKKGDTRYYIDKYNMWCLAKKIGMHVPNCVQLKKSDLQKLPIISYPCLIKPSHESEGFYNEFKFYICERENQLIKVLKRVRDSSIFVAQDFINCTKQLLVYGCRDCSSKTTIAGSMLVDRFSETGSSSHGEIGPDCFGYLDPSLIERFLDEIGYIGLFSFEFGILDDKAFFFEVNLRNDGTSNFFFQSGANLPLYLAYSFYEMDRSQINTTSSRGFAIDDLFDYENVIKKRLNKKQWRDDYDQSSFFKYYDKNDLEPYIVAKKKSRNQIFKDIILKKYRLYIVNILTKIGLRK